jgi:hypothetical protein
MNVWDLLRSVVKQYAARRSGAVIDRRIEEWSVFVD